MRTALEADVVITTGGVSVGEYDFVNEAFKNVGIEPMFWKVRMKPGKPVSFAQYQGKPVIASRAQAPFRRLWGSTPWSSCAPTRPSWTPEKRSRRSFWAPDYEVPARFSTP